MPLETKQTLLNCNYNLIHHNDQNCGVNVQGVFLSFALCKQRESSVKKIIFQ